MLVLIQQWNNATTETKRSAIWREMLQIHAKQVYGIGLVSGAPQPIVINRKLRNIPEHAIWAWDPGAHFGVHRMDEFFFEGGDG